MEEKYRLAAFLYIFLKYWKGEPIVYANMHDMFSIISIHFPSSDRTLMLSRKSSLNFVIRNEGYACEKYLGD